MQAVADTRLPVDGDTDGDKVRNITVDRPFGDLQLFGHASRRLDAVAPQQQDNLEKSVGASHGKSLLRTSCQRDGNSVHAYWREQHLLTEW
ncbi:hypothetical protein [Leptospirillum ferriphilum]|uniref:hypothetical protein n=1 Tax=Leptospirillum ferriphilum TaxID=178606 RepID=UPI001FD4FD1E|nr:hypothetical protein [Leptospirillum ferriphilum]